MNETELLDSPSTGLRTGLHDAQILAIKQDGRRVIIEIKALIIVSATCSAICQIASSGQPARRPDPGYQAGRPPGDHRNQGLDHRFGHL